MPVFFNNEQSAMRKEQSPQNTMDTGLRRYDKCFNRSLCFAICSLFAQWANLDKLLFICDLLCTLSLIFNVYHL